MRILPRRFLKLLVVFFLLEALAQGAHLILLNYTQYHFWDTYAAKRSYHSLNWFKYKYHPYLGFDEKDSFLNQPIAKNKGVFRIGILGGSVAESFGNFLIDKKDQILPPFTKQKRGKTYKINFDIINLARGSYKQPQQLIASILALEYIDLFLSIEGLNDTTLNHKACRPQSWPQQIGRFDPGLQSIYKSIANALREIYNFSYAATKHKLAFPKVLHYVSGSALLNIYYQFESKHTLVLLEGCNSNLEESNLDEQRIQAWLDDIKKQHLLINHGNREIYTFLQPNQYLRGTKFWSQEEKAIFSNMGSGYKDYVAKHYGLGVEKFRELVAQDSNYVDLTDVFKHTTEQIYIDECCHVGDKGNELMFKRIKPFIFKNLMK